MQIVAIPIQSSYFLNLNFSVPPVTLRPILRCLLIFICHSAGFCTAVHGEDALKELKNWTLLGSVDSAALASGAIEAKANSSMNLARGLSSQAVYYLDVPAEVAVETLRKFDGTKFPELKVFQHHSFLPEEDGKFAEIHLSGSARPLQRLLSETARPRNLQLSAEELRLLPATHTTATAEQYWSRLLHNRWSRFVQNGTIDPVAGVDLRAEIRALLAEEPQITTHFIGLLKPWTEAVSAPVPARYYWDLSETEGVANPELGTFFERKVGDRWQVADISLYASSSYLTAMTFYEFAPAPAGSGAKTLVWQGTLVSSTELAGGFGVKRKIAAHMIVDEMQQWIRLFRREASAAGK